MLGFSVLGLLIVAKEHDGGASITGGVLGIFLGAAFLIAARLHWKCCDQIQSGFQVEEVPALKSFLKCDKLPVQSVVSKSSQAVTRQSVFAFFHTSQAFLQSGYQVDHVALGGFRCRCLTFLPFCLCFDQLLHLASVRANAPRLVYRLVRGRRIFLRDICAAIFYSRERE